MSDAADDEVDLADASSIILWLQAEEDLNQTEIGQLLGVSKGAVSNWVTKRCGPNFDQIATLLDKLGYEFYIQPKKEQEDGDAGLRTGISTAAAGDPGGDLDVCVVEEEAEAVALPVLYGDNETVEADHAYR
jgi:transcriptional regulator with XRE-family HTH domain